MPLVRFTNHLRRFFSDLHEVEVPATTVAETVAELERAFPGMRGYITDEQGRLRRHMNVFVGDDQVRDRERLSDPVSPDSVVFIMQALSGG
jgi:molybdopterin converting factor small subunit